MKQPCRSLFFALLLPPVMLSGAAYAQTAKVDAGKQEFEANCAVCHATDAKGKGPFVQYLRTTPPDLTTLAQRNGGVMPVNRLMASIEGADVPSHTARDMPVWGNAYRIQAGEYYADTPYDPKAYVRSRILALVDYINRLQVR